MGNELNMSLFKIEQTSEIAKTLGFDLRKTKCGMCNKRLNSKNLGHFVHIEHNPATLCTDTVCFAQWFAKEKLEIVSRSHGGTNGK